MAESFPLSTVYCTDEDLAVRAAGDYGVLVPEDQVKAIGTDGVLASAGWSLTSSSTNFGTRGVKAGDMVKLWGPKGTAAATRFGPEAPGHWLAIDSVATTTIVLRRKGLAAGVGEPPGPAGGVTGVYFAVYTLWPQIERASRDLNARYFVDSSLAGRAPADLYSTEDLREACELTVLHKLYLALSRSAQRDDFKVKAGTLKEQLDEVLGRLALRWGSYANDRPPTVRAGRVDR